MIGSINFLYNTFNKYNAIIFGNTLPLPKLRISRSTKALGSFRNFRGKGVRRLPENCDIALSRNWDLEESALEDVVIHEMIHYYIWYNNLEDTSCHGRIFKGMMNEINHKYGRNIGIRTNPDLSEGRVRKVNRIFYYVAIVSFKDGSKYFIVTAKTKIKSAHCLLLERKDVKSVKWFYSLNGWFANFRCVSVFRMYVLTQDIEKQQFYNKVNEF